MHLTFSPRSLGLRCLTGRALAAAALVFMFTAPPLLSAARAAPGPATPPDFPDTTHVREGCYISSVAYVARFAAEFPGEFGAPCSVHPRIYPKRHTVALVTWAGEWWLRDEFAGVMRLNLPAASREITETVRRRAEVTLDRRVRGLTSSERARILSLGLHGSRTLDAAHEIAEAARLLPYASALYRVESNGREIPVLFFRPSPGWIALYDPHFGTATAETDSPRDAAIVEAIAERLGYRVTSVRRDFGPLLAATGP
ncbi:MAG: hypothetical protein Q8N18_22600 [Opitutaceae bacterium]|nr:hypothetical protein [Opitutaceae bacterium]